MTKIPTWAYRARTAIEGLIPRDGVINAATHVAVGVGAAGAAVVASKRLPDEDPERPERFSRADFLRTATNGLAFGAAPLFLTAGMMFQTPTTHALPRGITPNYFLAAGAVLGAAFVTHAAHDVIAN